MFSVESDHHTTAAAVVHLHHEDLQPRQQSSSSSGSVAYSSPTYDLHSSITSSASILNNHSTDYSHHCVGADAGSTDHHPAAADAYDHSLVEYKSEPPSTPTYGQDGGSSAGLGYPTSAFTPSPSSRGSESPHTAQDPYFFGCNMSIAAAASGAHPLHHDVGGGGSSLTADHNVIGGGGHYETVPTPPLSASHHTKDMDMVLPDTNVMLDGGSTVISSVTSWTDDQKGCICDNLLNSNEIEKLGKLV